MRVRVREEYREYIIIIITINHHYRFWEKLVKVKKGIIQLYCVLTIHVHVLADNSYKLFGENPNPFSGIRGPGPYGTEQSSPQVKINKTPRFLAEIHLATAERELLSLTGT